MVDTYQAVVLGKPPDNFAKVPDDQAIICVMDTIQYEVASYAYSPQEFSLLDDHSDFRKAHMAINGQGEGQSGVWVWQARGSLNVRPRFRAAGRLAREPAILVRNCGIAQIGAPNRLCPDGPRFVAATRSIGQR
jgi:hypothetical protein